jgi:hypothetical protein
MAIHRAGGGGVKEPVDLAHPSLHAMPSTDIIDIRLKHNDILSPQISSSASSMFCTAELIHAENTMANLAYAIGGKVQSAEFRTQEKR